MLQHAYRSFGCTYICRTMKRYLSLFFKYLFHSQHCFETTKTFINTLLRYSQTKRGISYLVKLFHSLKVFIAIKIFRVFSIIPIYIQRCLKEIRYGAIGPGGLCSKIVNFCHTETGLTSKWCRILPVVYW